MIARPARVRIRSRKPWVLDRRRLFGWNVRLLTRYSHYTTSTGARPPGGGRATGTGTRREPVPRPRISHQHSRESAGTGGLSGTDCPGPSGGPDARCRPADGPRRAPRRAASCSRARCRAVDEAVSVAVAQHRTPTSGAGAAPLVPTDHHAFRRTATTPL